MQAKKPIRIQIFAVEKIISPWPVDNIPKLGQGDLAAKGRSMSADPEFPR